jgi:hypothetical protein
VKASCIMVQKKAKTAATPANTHAEPAPFILIPVAAPEAEVLGAVDDFDTEGLAVTDTGNEEEVFPVLPATAAEFDEGAAEAPEAAPEAAPAAAPAEPDAPAAVPEAEDAPAMVSMPAR